MEKPPTSEYSVNYKYELDLLVILTRTLRVVAYEVTVATLLTQTIRSARRHKEEAKISLQSRLGTMKLHVLLNLAVMLSAFHCYICIQKVWLLASRVFI